VIAVSRLPDFQLNDVVLIDGKEFVFECRLPAESGRACDPDDIQFLDRRTRRPRCFTEVEFLNAFSEKRIVWADPDVKPGDVIDDDDNDDSGANLRRKQRLFWTTSFDANPVSKSTEPLAEFIAKHSSQQPGPPDWTPSPHTLRRWLRERGSPENRKPKYMGDRRHPGPRATRMDARAQTFFDAEAECFWLNRRISYHDVYVKVRASVALLNRERREQGHDLIPAPSYPTVWRHLRRSLTEARAKSRFGAVIAHRAFEAIKGSLEAKRINDLAIIDHKRMDCYVVDESRQFVLGRPWLTLMLDVRSRMVLGIHLSFEDPSVLTAMACVRMAVKPKLHLRERFPGLKWDWEAFGVPRTLLTDNGWEFVGSSFEDACTDAGISIEWAPVRAARYKGICERFFRRMDDQLVRKLPGSIDMKPHKLRDAQIDPQKDAILTIADLDVFLHEYIVNIYSTDLHEGIGEAPLKVWRERSEIDGIQFAHDLPALEQALAKHVKDRTLSTEGVIFKDLQYCSNEVTALLSDLLPLQPSRSVRFGTAKVKIKYHPEDMSRIFVWNEARGKYVTLPCTMPHYTEFLSERLHELVNGANKAKDAEFMSEDDRCIAKAEQLRKIEEQRAAASVKERRRSARLLPDRSVESAGGGSRRAGVVGPANRRGGDKPEKSRVRQPSQARAAASTVKYEASAVAEPTKKLIGDPFESDDLMSLLAAARDALT
jgi:putative transposase